MFVCYGEKKSSNIYRKRIISTQRVVKKNYRIEFSKERFSNDIAKKMVQKWLIFVIIEWHITLTRFKIAFIRYNLYDFDYIDVHFFTNRVIIFLYVSKKFEWKNFIPRFHFHIRKIFPSIEQLSRIFVTTRTNVSNANLFNCYD